MLGTGQGVPFAHSCLPALMSMTTQPCHHEGAISHQQWFTCGQQPIWDDACTQINKGTQPSTRMKS